jgi:hypothetical protein
MADGTTKRVDQMRQGDYVLCPSSTRPSSGAGEPIVAQVQSILRTFSSAGVMKLIYFPQSGLLVTPWHPIKSNTSAKKWTFPAVLHASKRPDDSIDFKPIKTEAVYSFLLGPELSSSSLQPLNCQERERGQTMKINGVECLALAHGILHDDIASHPFYGTEKIVTEMIKRGRGEGGRGVGSSSCGEPSKVIEEYVDLFEGDVLKDPNTDLAMGFRHDDE